MSVSSGKSAAELQEAAHVAVESFINSLNCQTKDDVLMGLKALTAMSVAAHNMVATGKSEVVQ